MTSETPIDNHHHWAARWEADDVATDEVSDGYHTFGELYDHRRALTAALMAERVDISWRSKAHHPDDSPMLEGGYFVVGINTPAGTVTYHYKLTHWGDFTEVPEVPHAPKWDGATPADTVTRLLAWAKDEVPLYLLHGYLDDGL